MHSSITAPPGVSARRLIDAFNQGKINSPTRPSAISEDLILISNNPGSVARRCPAPAANVSASERAAAENYIKTIGPLPAIDGPECTINDQFTRLGTAVKAIAEKSPETQAAKKEAQSILKKAQNSPRDVGVVLALTLKENPSSIGGFDQTLLSQLQGYGYGILKDLPDDEYARGMAANFWSLVISQRQPALGPTPAH